MSDRPTAAERFFFDTNGYLIVEDVLDAAQIAGLSSALERAVRHRSELARHGRQQGGPLQSLENGTRIFYLLHDDPLFLDLLDYQPVMPYVTGLLNQRPHFHASDAFLQRGPSAAGPGWHIDGEDNGYRYLGSLIPLLQLKIGYFLSDMRTPDQGNLMIVPGSHRSQLAPDADQLAGFDTLPGAIQLCCGPGSCVMFHNALWHSRGPASSAAGERILLYYAYEHPWMAASPEPTAYPASFYASLSESRRALFPPVMFQR